ncbi:type II CAAX endopeptidase family protein [Sphingomonas sp. ASV193]|uniref:CPBP family intramembrane glutamic endopeptidase n=1 Tax=Sphingomonas sp. ASV193 TaxID=3144405 RepID=UPI0032E8BE4F
MNEGVAAAEPTWKRVVKFPLVAMVLAILIYALGGTAGALIDKAIPLRGTNLSAALKTAILVVCFVLAYKVGIRKLGEVPRDDLVVSRKTMKELALGLLVGLVIFSAVVGTAALFHVYRIIGQGDASQLVIALAATAVIPGLTEELLFRGILFRWLEEFGGSWFGLAASSLLFGFAHYFNPQSTVIACLWIAVEAGILLGGVYMLTRNLWMAMGVHAAWNFTQGEIFDIPVSGLDSHGLVEAQLSGPPLLSGGAFGLEASVIALVIATAAGLWFVWLAARRGNIVRPWWVRRRLAREATVPHDDVTVPSVPREA